MLKKCFWTKLDRDLENISLLEICLSPRFRDLEKFQGFNFFLSPKIEKNIISLLYESKSVHYYTKKVFFTLICPGLRKISNVRNFSKSQKPGLRKISLKGRFCYTISLWPPPKSFRRNLEATKRWCIQVRPRGGTPLFAPAIF